MLESTVIDTAIEQAVRHSSDRDALTDAVRALADVMGYRLTPKAERDEADGYKTDPDPRPRDGEAAR